MGIKGSEKHLFLGGNTPVGFFSYFSYLVPLSGAKRMYCIKGGPGTGKSSFMKKIAAEAVKRGHDVELMHCSSDPNSLDGVLIKPCNIAFVDGTSPHIVDPKAPGAVDEILNFGDCWDKKGMQEHREDIIRTNARISCYFQRAYVYLAAAKTIWEDIRHIQAEAVGKNVHASFLENLTFQEFAELPIAEVPGKERKLFASAITPKGVINYLDTIAFGYKTYVLKGYTGTAVEEAAQIAIRRGLDVEKYYCPFRPEGPCEHLLVPKLNLALVTSNQYHRYDNGELVDFGDFVSRYTLERYRDALAFDQKMCDTLLDRAVATIAKAKEHHDELEKFYIPNMDFDKIDSLYEKTLKEVLAML